MKSIRERLAGDLGLSVPLGLSLDDMEKLYYMLDETELLDSKGNPARIDVIRHRIVLRAIDEGIYNIELVRKHIYKAFDSLCRKKTMRIPHLGKEVVNKAINNASAEELYRIWPTQSLNMDYFLQYVNGVLASSK